jgi:adenylate cyclase
MLNISYVSPHDDGSYRHDQGPLEIGRGPAGDDTPRIQLRDSYVSRDHLQLTSVGPGRILARNLSARVPLRSEDGASVAPGDTCEMQLPLTLVLGETRVTIEEASDSSIEPAPGSYRTIATPYTMLAVEQPLPTLSSLTDSAETRQLVRWFEKLAEVQRAAATSSEFFETTARALVEMVGLDCGYVLEHKGQEWKILSSHSRLDGPAPKPSRSLLNQLAAEKRTFCRDADADQLNTLSDIESVVASPVLENDQVVGAIYGMKNCPLSECGTIRELEVHAVQALAAAVATGGARMRHQAEATRRRVQFEQFFSSELSEELHKNPKLLEGRDVEITALFADIRGFSSLSENLDAEKTCALVSAVLGQITRSIREEEGVVVSYLGDGLLAMWNAPSTHEDHAQRACRAALHMVQELPEIEAKWQNVVGSPIRIGVGINTGPARVGNIGSDQKFHYGPLGHTVNLASRIESTTKLLGVPILISGSTKERIDDSLHTRRLCSGRLAGMVEPVPLYELVADPGPDHQSRRTIYEEALGMYETRLFSEAGQRLVPLMGEAREARDLPTLMLARLCIDCLLRPTEAFDSTWELQHK